MDINKYRDTKYLKKEEVAKPILVTIHHCEEQDVSQSGQAEKLRCVIFFKEDYKPYIANWTALQEIHQMAGDGDAEHWDFAWRLDHKLPEIKIVVYLNKDVTFGGKKVGGIQVRAPRKPAVTTPDVQQEAVMPEDEFDTAMQDGEPPVSDEQVPF